MENPLEHLRSPKAADTGGGNPLAHLRTAPERSLGEAAASAATNFPADVMRVGGEAWEGVKQVAANPGETAATLGRIAAGGVQKLIPGEQDYEADFDAMVGQGVDGIVEKYGGWENAKRTLAERPAEFALDVLALPYAGLRLGGAALKALPKPPAKGPSRKEFVEGAPSTADLKGEGGTLFEDAKASGATIPKHAMQSFRGKLHAKMAGEGIDKVLHPKVTRMVTMVDELENGADVQQMMNMRRHFQEAAKSTDPSERRLAKTAMDMADDFMSTEAGPTAGKLGEARKLWSRMRKSELIEETIKKAHSRAAGVEAGLRNEFSTLLRNNRKMRGFSKAERAAVEAVSKGNVTQNTLRRLGGLSLGEGQRRNTMAALVGMLAGGAGGTMVAGPVGGALAIASPIVGAVAQRLARGGAVGRANVARAAAATGRAPPAPPSLAARAGRAGATAGRVSARPAGAGAGFVGGASLTGGGPEFAAPPGEAEGGTMLAAADDIRIDPASGARYRLDPATGEGVLIQ